MSRLPRALGNSWAALAFRLGLAGLLLASGGYQARFPAEFAETLAAYQLLPEILVNPLAALLPWLKLVCGALLLAGVRIKAAALTAALLLAASAAGLGAALLRGLPVPAGCPLLQDGPLGWVALLADLAWLALALHVFSFDCRFQLERRLLARGPEA